MNEEDIHSKLVKYLEKELLSDADKKEIEQWLAKGGENRKYLDQIKEIDLNANLTRFRDNMRLTDAVSGVKKNGSRRMKFVPGIAAAILFVLLSAAIIYVLKFRQVSHIQQISSVQENTELILSDGSTISLNKGSILDYPKKPDGRKREVTLSGEAYFEVSKKKNTPFYVYLDNATVKVLGTSFNIKEGEEGQIHVHVLTGKISFFETENRSNAVELAAGEQAVYDPVERKFEQSDYSSKNFLFWKTGKLSFVDQPLDHVFKDLEQSFPVRIVVNDPLIYKNRLTSECEDQQLEEILEELTIVFSLRYHKEGNTVYVQKKP